MHDRNFLHGSIFTILSAAAIGISFLFSKISFSERNIRTFLCLWMAFAGFYSTAIFWLQGGSPFAGAREYWLRLFLLGLINFVSAYSFYTAIQFAPIPSIVALLIRMATIPSVVFSVAILKETIPPIAALGALLLLLGSLMLSYVTGKIGWTLILLAVVFSTTETITLTIGKIVAKRGNA